uniref:fukutin-like n=1 Tax=Styela clava TaxID=7725 RepID=UPI00193A3CA0|nr:fukutin-like [Styela clava]
MYKDVTEKLSSVRIRTLVLAVIAVSVSYLGVWYYKRPKQVEPYVKNQWHNLYLLSGPFQTWNVPLIIFDVEILPHVFKPRREIWHDPAYTCRILCKHHPDGNNLLTFAILARKFIPEKDKIIDRLQKFGFATHLSMVPDPRLHDAKEVIKIPTYLWLARNDHVIHITILHERHGNYYWAGPVTDSDWFNMVNELKPQLTIDWRTLNGAVFPRYAQAYEMSHHLTGVATKIDKHEFIVPYNIKSFLKEYKEARFIECDHERAKKYRDEYPVIATQEEYVYQSDAKKLLIRAKKVLNKLGIPFWLSSGTLLGWYRECGIIPHGIDVDIGIWIHDYHNEIIPAMEREGLMLKHVFGRIQDSHELSFIDEKDVKLDIFFFYQESDSVWNGGTRAYDGAKFKYKFPKFSLCWTEHLEDKFRVPCETRSYIEANYGEDWDKPVKDWVWYSSPPNVEDNGYWEKSEWNEVIQVYDRVRNQPKVKVDL